MLADIGKLTLRVSIGALMLFHGINKIIGGVGWIENQMIAMGLPAFLAWSVLIGEVCAPIMLIIGFRVKIGASLIALTMMVAIILVSKNGIIATDSNGGWILELPVLYLIASITIFCLGAGKYSLEQFKIIKRK